ncbi:hypothetical protein DEJ50_26315 [Streptomyces venezuelae]|uniref:Cobyrinic acid a,c-diamide synthase n=1 Tax=Streptomyces venezuelae TaxID=54571 RepID=A0A5P2D6M1_STRVZ|nr:hypothetical protein DEJ50_26315 [Streptomyces venezuelae]
MSLPGADELFRTTGGMALQSSTPRRGTEEVPPEPAPAPAPVQVPVAAPEPVVQAPPPPVDPVVGSQRRPQEGSGPAAGAAPRRKGRGANRRPSGRERHDEKITVYVSAEELMDLEHARLVLRGEHGLAVDRGRIVREAVAVVLADLESRGDASILVRRLRGR